MATSVNGWPVLAADSPKLHTWQIPTPAGVVKIRLRNGSAGFLLAHFLLWFSERVEPIKGGVLDDWGYAVRPIRGATTGYSNHASGTAADVNATRHPLGKRGTFTRAQTLRIRARLAIYRGAIVWGAGWRRPDPMHFEIGRTLRATEIIAKRLLDTDRGRRILAANPGQKAVILS